MSIYNRAMADAPQVDRRIVRAVDRVLVSLPAPGGVFGRVDVWNALQANAKEAGVPMDLDAVQVGKALDVLCLAAVLTCRGGAYSVAALRMEVPAPADLAPTASGEPATGPATPEPAAPELPPALAAVVEVLGLGPMSSTEIRERMQITPSAAITRLARLMQLGVVRKGAEIPSRRGGVLRHLYELVPHGTREVPPVPEAEDEVLPALGQAETPPDHADLLAALKRFAPSSVDATTPEEALAARVQGALRYIAELEAEGAGLVGLCNEAHSELEAAGAPDGTPAERVRWLVGRWTEARDAEEDPRLALLAEIGAVLSLGAPKPAEQLLRQLRAADNRSALLGRVRAAELAERRVRALMAEVEDLRARERPAGPAWPSLHNLDLDAAEQAIAEIERRCVAWRTLLQAARDLA